MGAEDRERAAAVRAHARTTASLEAQPRRARFTLRGAAGLTYVEAIRPQDNKVASQLLGMFQPDGHVFTEEDVDLQVLRLAGAVKNKRDQWAKWT